RTSTVNIRVFAYGVLLALAFGLVSGVYPAWRMAQTHPVEALKGGRRRMTRHLISLIWNRKRHNILLAAEIFFSFLVLFGVAFTGLFYATNWRQPLGFDIDRVWSINVIRT